MFDQLKTPLPPPSILYPLYASICGCYWLVCSAGPGNGICVDVRRSLLVTSNQTDCTLQVHSLREPRRPIMCVHCSLLPCLLTCLSFELPACMPSCLAACLPSCLAACLPCLLACLLPVCLHACCPSVSLPVGSRDCIQKPCLWELPYAEATCACTLVVSACQELPTTSFCTQTCALGVLWHGAMSPCCW